MELNFGLAHSGAPTCAAGALRLHSSYDPAREAERFALSAIGEGRPSHVLVLGACLDYLTPALRALLPRARLVAVQYSPAFSGRTVGEPDASWEPGTGTGLDAFLDAALDEDAISGVEVLEWEPAARAFPEEAAEAREAVRASLDRLTSSAATVKASGKLWIANACASFLLAERPALSRSTGRPVLVAAAGPSLEASLRRLGAGSLGPREGLRRGFILVSVSSALAACRAAGYEPDIVVATDGGYWSRLHLYPLAARGEGRARADRAPVLATSLAARPSASIYRDSPLLLLDQGSFAEAELLPGLCRGRTPALRLPPHGTVSGSALQLALRLGRGPIVFAGLDLASYGERDHARPHGFDPFVSEGSSRLSSLESRLWARRGELSPIELPTRPWRSSRSLQAYASALEMDARSAPGRLFRLGPEPFPLANFQLISGEEMAGLAAASALGESEACIDGEIEAAPLREREDYLATKLRSWKERAASAAGSMAEGSLLGSGGAEDRLLAELLRSIDIVDYAAARRAALSGGDPGPCAAELGRRAAHFLGDLERRFFP